MRSSGTPKTGRKECTIAVCETSFATNTARSFATFTSPPPSSDYRAIYRAYLHDPDLQDARARWPFVNMWDNHEFSWKGWQSLEKFDGKTLPRQTRKVAANQAFFEYQPARLSRPAGLSLERFNPPLVVDAPISHFDEHGMGIEPNNRAALNSLTGYRSLRWGRNVELIVTDQRSYRSEEPLDRDEAQAFASADFPELLPEEAMQILDAGRDYNHGNAPSTIRYGNTDVANFAQTSPPQTILGFEQKQWFLERLKSSNATWKVWGNTTATLDMRADPQNLPSGITRPWPGAAYAGFSSGDHSTAFVERAEIYDFVRDHGITGFATIAGDRHSFWAGLAAKALPPKPFDPVGIAFVTGSISAPTMLEAIEHSFPKEHPLRPLFLGQATWRSRASAHSKSALAAWRALMPRIRKERRHREGSSSIQSRSLASRLVRRHGRPRIRGRASHQRRIRSRVRLHPPAPGTQ